MGLVSRIWLPLVSLVLLVCLRLLEPVPLMNLRLMGFDLLTQWSERPLTPDQNGRVLHTVIIDIDDETLKRHGQWPWPRTEVARLVDAALAQGAASVALDMVFPEADRVSPGRFAETRRDLDPALAAALQALPDNDRLFAQAIGGKPVVLGQAGSVDATLIDPARAPPASRIIVKLPDGAPDPTGRFLSVPAMIRNLPVLEQAAAGLGQIVPFTDSDGIIRRVPMVMKAGDVLVPSLSLELLRVMTGARLTQLTVDPATGRPKLLIRLGPGQGNLAIPLNGDGALNVWYNHTDMGRSLLLPAHKLLSGDVKPGVIEGKLVLVGTSAAGLADNRNTPIGVIPGVEVHAQLIETILGGRYIRQPENGRLLEVLLLILGGLAVLATVPFMPPRASMPLLPLLLCVLGVGGWYAFSANGLLIDAIVPMIGTVFLHGQAVYGNFAAAEKKRRMLREAFAQYLSPALVRQLADNPDKLSLSGETRDMTFLFTDIAGFTGFTEKTRPQDLVRLLNAYLDEACRIVMDHGGTIDKIVGDAIHAMFNAPLDQPDHAERAVACARALDAFGRRFQAAAKADGFDFGETRIGLNSGPAVVGNFGGARRFDYTAHGDSINTAARMESVNKHLGTTVCISGPVIERLGSDQGFRKIGVLVLKGKTEGIAAFAPVPVTEDGAAPLPDYAKAYRMMCAGEDAAAHAEFERLADLYPADPVVAFHRKRLSAGERGEIIRFAEK